VALMGMGWRGEEGRNDGQAADCAGESGTHGENPSPE
jgi:hypothetical protein